MQFKLSVVAVGILTSMSFLPEAAPASCIDGICVSGHDVGNIRVIEFSTTLNNVTHYNFNDRDGQGQRELGGNETEIKITIPPRRPVTVHYSFQACGGGGVFQTLSCRA